MGGSTIARTRGTTVVRTTIGVERRTTIAAEGPTIAVVPPTTARGLATMSAGTAADAVTVAERGTATLGARRPTGRRTWHESRTTALHSRTTAAFADRYKGPDATLLGHRCIPRVHLHRRCAVALPRSERTKNGGRHGRCESPGASYAIRYRGLLRHLADRHQIQLQSRRRSEARRHRDAPVGASALRGTSG